MSLRFYILAGVVAFFTFLIAEVILDPPSAPQHIAAAQQEICTQAKSRMGLDANAQGACEAFVKNLKEGVVKLSYSGQGFNGELMMTWTCIMHAEKRDGEWKRTTWNCSES